MSEQLIQTDVETAEKLGLNKEEYQKINQILGRSPNFTELSIFSVMWSEHCSYKNSIHWLKQLPKEGEHLLVEAGEENAGLVDIGNGQACAFKIESHNHPSAVEPYQGAATGVGGIHRDIFTMGARPIAALNSLRFGDIHLDRTQHLVDGVVRGIGDYGNCLGVPTVGGETYFMPCYNQNILVNAMSVGTVKIGETASAIALGAGNPVLIVGSATGKDGIHGATFASADLSEDSAKDLPAVQVGDPFQEKLLLEASLEAIKTGKLVGMQDMGAAGITCSTSEMSAKGEVGMDINLDKVPTRQPNMKPFEILLSESQERMLLVVEKGSEQLFYDIFDKWDLECEHIGNVTDSKRIRFYQNDHLVADVPADDLVLGGGAPVYEREYSKPKYLEQIESFDQQVPTPSDYIDVMTRLVKSPNIASKKWIYEQYDNTVRTNSTGTVLPSDAAVIRLKNSQKALVITTDCNSSYVYADPNIGTQIAVTEAARNIVCSGGKPLAITNCLNFGNPYNPEVFWQFKEAILGMSTACIHYNTPVTGGNVSFYNQSVINDKTIPVYPTPTIGMLGIIDNIDDRITLPFKQEGDLIVLLGTSPKYWSTCEYLRVIHQIENAPVPGLNLTDESKLHEAIWSLNRDKLIQSAHDISEGGLFLALLESGMTANLGFDIITSDDIRLDLALFSEDQGRILITIKPTNRDRAMKILNENSLDYNIIGNVTTNDIKINANHYENVNHWKTLYDNYLNTIFEH